jgi:hypothetical protein
MDVGETTRQREMKEGLVKIKKAEIAPMERKLRRKGT